MYGVPALGIRPQQAFRINARPRRMKRDFRVAKPRNFTTRLSHTDFRRYMSQQPVYPEIKIPAFFRKRWVLHAFFWIIYVVATLVSDSRAIATIPDEYPWLFLATDLVAVPYTYALTLWAIPRFLYRGKWPLFLLSSAILLVAACFLMYFASIPVLERLYTRYPEASGEAISVVDFFGINVLFLFLVLGLKVAKDAFMADQQRRERERLLLAEELNQLRAQIGPHFLLNSLNSVYGLSLTAPDAVPDTVLRLADLLRFTLYEARHPEVPIAVELQFIQDYITLQSLRASDKLHFEASLPDLQESRARIAPLLLIVFLENAFKFVQPNAKGERFLTVAIRLEADRHLDFQVRNTHQPQSGPAEQGGVGLGNVRRRLALLYPERHQLTLTDAAGVYAVHLQIDLQP